MADSIYPHIELVDDGKKAKWPLEAEYKEPIKKGYVFDGWDFDWENTAVTDAVPSNHEIHAKWDKIAKIVAEANHTVIKSEGDSESDPTKMYYYILTENGKYLYSGVEFEKVEIDSNEKEIVFKNGELSETVENDKNVKTGIVIENDSDLPKYYRFKAVTSSNSPYGAMVSDVIEIVQAGNGQILLPDFDYFVFKYNWTDNDGEDLDSITCLDSTIDGSPNPVNLSNDLGLYVYPVGFGLLGWSNFSFPTKVSSNPNINAIHYSGDNKESGMEGAVIDIKSIISSMTYKTITVSDPSLPNVGDYYIDEDGNKFQITQVDNTSNTITYKTGYIDNYSKLVFNIYNCWYRTKNNGNATISFDAYKGGEINIDTTAHTFTPSSDSNKVIDTSSQNLSIKAGTASTGVSLGQNGLTMYGNGNISRFPNSPNLWASNLTNATEYDNFIKRSNFIFTKVATLTYDIKSKMTVIDFNKNPKGLVKLETSQPFHGFYGTSIISSIPSMNKVPSSLLSIKVDGKEVTYETGYDEDIHNNYLQYTQAYLNKNPSTNPRLPKSNFYMIPSKCHVTLHLSNVVDADNGYEVYAKDSDGKEYTWSCNNLTFYNEGFNSKIKENNPWKMEYDYDESQAGKGTITDEKGNTTIVDTSGTVSKSIHSSILSNIVYSNDGNTIDFDVNNEDTVSGYRVSDIHLFPKYDSNVTMNTNATNSGIYYNPQLLLAGTNSPYIDLLIKHG